MLPPVTKQEDDDTTTILCELSQFADAGLQVVRLKHLFGHQTGMIKSGVDVEDTVRDYLDELRG